MARTPGSFSLGGTIETQADAPLDARLQVKTKADLTTAGSFPYKYVGMIVSVASETKAYMLIGSDPTDIANWKDMSSGGGGGGTSDYTDLDNKPQINNTTLVGNKSLADLGINIPENTSDLNNDSGFITSSDIPAIPENTSDLNNDSGFITASDIPSIPENTSDLTNDSGFITNAVNDLISYYLKSETYTKTEVDAIVAAIKNSRFEAVSVLPTEDIETNVIYLVPKSDPEAGDIKDEYINLDGTTAGWEKIGSTDVDLSGYVTTTALNTALAAYTTTTDLTALLANYVEASSLATVATTGDYSDLQNTPTIPTAISDLTDDSDFVEHTELSTVATTGEYSDLLNTPTIPDAVQVDTLPTADSTLVGTIYQYIGSTGTYTNGYFYECVEDSGNYSWEQKDVQPSGGSGGDAELSEAVTSNLAVGAIPSGTTLAQGTTFTEFAKKLLITELAPTIAFSLSKSGNVAYGESYTETLTLAVSNMGSAKKIDKIEWYEGNTLKKTDNVDSSVAGSWTYTMGTATTDTTTFKAVVTYTKSNDATATDTKTASINFYYNKFYGSVGSLTPDEATVEVLTSALATAKGGTYSFTTSAARIAYAYPKSLGALTSIKDGNGFSLFDSFTRTEQSYTQNSTTVAYYLYVLTDATSVTNYSVIFA